MGRDKFRAKKRVEVPEGGWAAAARKQKLPRVQGVESPVKKPTVLHLDQDDIRERHLVWRFGDVDRAGEWPPAHLGEADFALLLEKMASFESMTIGEIFAIDSEHGKRYPLSDLPAKTRKRLEEIDKDDEDDLARLRMGARPRLYGFLREHVFHVVWWDAEHAVYPSKKKHT